MLYKDIKSIEDSGNIDEAKKKYREEVEKGNFNYYFYGYNRCCKKLGLDDELLIFLSDHKDMLNDEVIANKYAWIIYKKNVKNETDVLKLQEYGSKIIQYCKQGSLENNNSTPYVLTIIRIVKILKCQNNPNYRFIKDWIMKLNPINLSDNNIYRYQDESGIDRENPSYKEFYIQTLSKCYEKLGLDKDCVEFCEQSLKLNIKWHYNNQRWIKARMFYCKCKIADNYDVAIEDYKNFVEVNKFWYMYYKLGNLYFRKNDLTSALKFQCLALDFGQEHKKLVNVLLQLAYIFQAKGEVEKTKIFAQASASLRMRNMWGICEDLEFLISTLSIDTKVPINWKLIKDIKNEIISDKNFSNINKGKIVKLLKNGFSGFIKQEDLSKDVFFNMSDVLFDKKLVKEGLLVKYKLTGKEGMYKAIKLKMEE